MTTAPVKSKDVDLKEMFGTYAPSPSESQPALNRKRHSFVQVRVHGVSVPLQIVSHSMSTFMESLNIYESPLRAKADLCLKCQWLSAGHAQKYSTTFFSEASANVSSDEKQGVIWGQWSPHIDFVCGVAPKGVQAPRPQAGQPWLCDVQPDALITARVFVLSRFVMSEPTSSSSSSHVSQQLYHHLGYFDIRVFDPRESDATAQVVDMRSFTPTSFDGRCYWDEAQMTVVADEASSITGFDLGEVGRFASSDRALHCLRGKQKNVL